MSHPDDRHTDEQLVRLAELVLAVARMISTDAHRDPEIVDLTSTEINVMRYVDRHPGTSPSAVAVGTGLQRSNLSRVLRDLEAKGMVAKTAADSDGRQMVLQPTALAAADLQRLRASWVRLLSSVEVDWRDVDTVLALLTELDAGLVPAVPGPPGGGS